MIMKSILKSIFPILAVIVLASCEKKIDYDLESADPKIVIEGIVNDGGGPAIVKLTTSTPFDASNEYPAVTGASVVIVETIGDVVNEFVLNETTPGIYESAVAVGTPGASYHLTVTSEGAVYEATSVMPFRVEIAEYNLEEFFGDNLFVNVGFSDPAEYENFYKFKLIRNDTLSESLFIQDDVFTNGYFNTALLGGQFEAVLPGDQVWVEMQTIDENVYNYWYSLSLNINDATAAPANPVTNLSNDALGYFSAQTSDIIEFTAP
jgi:hypothetical protein